MWSRFLGLGGLPAYLRELVHAHLIIHAPIVLSHVVAEADADFFALLELIFVYAVVHDAQQHLVAPPLVFSLEELEDEVLTLPLLAFLTHA